jgi:hypothetical protein
VRAQGLTLLRFAGEEDASSAPMEQSVAPLPMVQQPASASVCEAGKGSTRTPTSAARSAYKS